MVQKTSTINPNHKVIRDYYAALARFRDQDVHHEMAIRAAFQSLLEQTARKRNLTFIPELSLMEPGRRVVPDGTIRDQFNLARGHWEAKDSGDDLDTEIDVKRRKGYPFTNIIFEDSQTGVLFQNGREILRVDLADAEKLARLLNEFFAYEAPHIEEFHKAVETFGQKIPDLAVGLVEKIKFAHKDNKEFIGAFNGFFALCKEALNPNIRVEAVDEMLVQHLLTERLFRTVLDNPEFTRRNIIAAEVEKTILALESRAFNRAEFQKSLDHFYGAIERAGHDLTDFKEKQHFLNSVYERFFQGYAIKVADTHGIVYTPQPVVDFMCASVEQALEKEFGLSLGSREVNILDPCTGTGNFIVNLLRRIPKQDLRRVYQNQLFANEVMLLPYYIASLNIEHAYYEQTGNYEPFDGMCFVDTLDIAEGQQGEIFTRENTRRVMRQKEAPIFVIIGNPPYNVGQLNENDNNKNRQYKTVDASVRNTYAKDSKATNKNVLFDAYVKFFRWATDRLKEREGIVCFVSNNSFVDNIAFDGMRDHLLRDFDLIYTLDLKGNIRKDSMRDGIALGEKHTVFGLSAMVGISVSLFMKSAKRRKKTVYYHGVDFRSTREEKFRLLREAGNIAGINWRQLKPDAKHTWLVSKMAGRFDTFMPIGTKETKSGREKDAEAIFKIYGRGVATCRDSVVYDFDREALAERVKEFIEDYNTEVLRLQARLKATGGKGLDRTGVDNFVKYDTIKWSRDLKLDLVRGKVAKFTDERIRTSLYRPFTKRWLFFDRILNEEVYVFPRIFPTEETEKENRVICMTGVGSEKKFFPLLVNYIANLAFVGFGTSLQCFPFYTYDEDGTRRRENITEWALKQFRGNYNDKKITKGDIFYYAYGLLHHAGYRNKYADCLKRDLPRIPFAPDFRAFSKAGKKLAEWHLGYEKVEPYEMKWVEDKKAHLSEMLRVNGKMRLSKDKKSLVVNRSLTLAGIPAKAFDYRLGNRSALEWVIDQYQVKEDKRSGIVSDPNRRDDPEYIVRLVGRVIRVSLETVDIVDSLPKEFE